jgi:hypothetical protein
LKRNHSHRACSNLNFCRIDRSVCSSLMVPERLWAGPVCSIGHYAPPGRLSPSTADVGSPAPGATGSAPEAVFGRRRPVAAAAGFRAAIAIAAIPALIMAPLALVPRKVSGEGGAS